MAHPSFNFVRNVNEQIMIPEGHTIEDIKKREQIIRDFYREWKKKSISRQCEMLNFCPLCVVEVYALRCDAMRAGTSRYPLHRPTTTYCFKARNRIAIRVVIPSTNSPMTLQRYAVFHVLHF